MERQDGSVGRCIPGETSRYYVFPFQRVRHLPSNPRRYTGVSPNRRVDEHEEFLQRICQVGKLSLVAARYTKFAQCSAITDKTSEWVQVFLERVLLGEQPAPHISRTQRNCSRVGQGLGRKSNKFGQEMRRKPLSCEIYEQWAQERDLAFVGIEI
jgi:hypothetical protein